MVAQTARIQRAKRLLDTTTLPISEITFLSGFGSLRRFNAVFAHVYKRQPSETRRSIRAHSVPVERARFQRPDPPDSPGSTGHLRRQVRLRSLG
ncbi:MAG TPA: helix-turn-helix domain-containing protein [Acetobacteraceae bacterium]|nr:helix-turn-helix domain-containing protein [Acetobacteraceae bacterium]